MCQTASIKQEAPLLLVFFFTWQPHQTLRWLIWAKRWILTRRKWTETTWKPVQPRQRMTLSCAWYSQHLLPLTPAIVSLMVKRDYFDVFLMSQTDFTLISLIICIQTYKHGMTCLMISWLNDSIIQCTFLTAKTRLTMVGRNSHLYRTIWWISIILMIIKNSHIFIIYMCVFTYFHRCSLWILELPTWNSHVFIDFHSKNSPCWDGEKTTTGLADVGMGAQQLQ